MKKNFEIQVTYITFGAVLLGFSCFLWCFFCLHILGNSNILDGVLLFLDEIFIGIPKNAKFSYSSKVYRLISYYAVLSTFFFGIIFSFLDIFFKNKKHVMIKNQKKHIILSILFDFVFVLALVYVTFFIGFSENPDVNYGRIDGAIHLARSSFVHHLLYITIKSIAIYYSFGCFIVSVVYFLGRFFNFGVDNG